MTDNDRIWKEGYEASSRGVAYKRCPYPEDSDERKRWQEGHRAEWEPLDDPLDDLDVDDIL